MQNNSKTIKSKQSVKTIKKNKKQEKNPWKFIIPIFCGLLGVFTIFTIFMNLSRDRVLSDYDDYSKYEIKLTQKVLNNSSDPYYVYIYKNDCSSCKSIKRYIFQYMDKFNENPTEKCPKMYLFNIEKHMELGSTSENLIGVSSYDELQVQYTPTMILVNNGSVSSAYNSASDVVKVFENYLDN